MTVGGNLSYGTDAEMLGIGPKFQYRIDETWRGEASFTYFLEKNDATAYDFNANVHYLIPIVSDLTLFPLAGLSYYNWKADVDYIDIDGHHRTASSSDGKLGLNLGCGIEYPITDKLKATGETKYQYINKADQLVFTVGLTWKL
jgi:outer membrane protein X